MSLITFEDYTDFTREEEKLRKMLKGQDVPMDAPKEITVSNILNYSKAHSVRKLNLIGDQEFMLN